MCKETQEKIKQLRQAIKEKADKIISPEKKEASDKVNLLHSESQK